MQQLVHKTKPTTKKIVLQLPKPLLTRVIKREIKRLYGTEYHPHVVRQHRNIAIGKLDVLDYAVPCFELAKKLRKNANQVAKEISSSLEASVLQLNGYGIEAVNGYVNFKLPTQVFEGAAKAAGLWLKKPSNFPSFDTRKDDYLIMNWPLDEITESEVTDLAMLYLKRAYTLVSKKYTTTYLMSDASERLIPLFEEALLATQEEKSHYINASQQVRELLMSPKKEGSGADTIVQTQTILRDGWIERQKNQLNADTKGQKLVCESSLTKAVNQYLNKLALTKSNKTIITDQTTAAMYFNYGVGSVALRSAKGFLYSSAYLLYVLARCLDDAAKNSSRVIVLAPHHLHSQLQELARFVAHSRHDSRQLVFFDPHVSQADILELRATHQTLINHFSDVSSYLSAFDHTWLANKQTRYALLSLIDIPTELVEQVSALQLPAIFDTLSQSVEMLAVLHGQA